MIGARHRAADAFEIGGDLAPDVAPVEIVKPGMRELLKRRGKRGLLRARAPTSGTLSVEEECRLESGCLGHFGQLFCRESRLAARDDVALASVLDRGRRAATSSGSLPPCRLGGIGSEHPGGDRARHRERCKRPRAGISS